MIYLSSLFPFFSFSAPQDPSLPVKADEPLREFVYLDEVSLSSLLASQRGEQTENIVSAAGHSDEVEIGSRIGSNVPLSPSVELNSRFQTTNSSSLQTTRKANAQSLFRELHRMKEIRKIMDDDIEKIPSSIGELLDNSSNYAFAQSTFRRGDLVELKVRLSASWIFQISTMVSEFSDIFDQNPVMFVENVNISDLFQAQGAQKVLDKLLGGLIPVEGIASHYGVLRHGSEEYIVHLDAVKGFDLEIEPLFVAGVTEHLAYWKDIRRVLFSDHEYTILCRIGKDGIHGSWNPIKTADVFEQFAPDMARQIEVSSKAVLINSRTENNEAKPKFIMNLALARYKDDLCLRLPKPLSGGQSQDIDRKLANEPFSGDSPEGQRAAFAKVRGWIEDYSEHSFDSAEDLALREKIRDQFAIPLFDSPSAIVEQIPEGPVSDHDEVRHLLDVEVVAIYW